MIVIKLVGGLGNQMFQYAAVKHLAIKLNTELKLDITSFQNNSLRNYELECFKIQDGFASTQEIEFTKWRSKRGVQKFFFRLSQKTKPYYHKTIFHSETSSFDPNFFKISDNTYVTGFFQSEKYFVEVEDIIKNIYQFANKPSVLYKQIRDYESIAIHFRRGDYVNDEKTFQAHGVCSMEYYKRAIEEITQRIKHPHFFIFSDNISWVKENLKLNHPHYFVENNKRGYEDLQLMSLCKHQIIANSTFSWWAAWLNENHNKVVISPKKWYNDGRTKENTFIPNGWLQI